MFFKKSILFNVFAIWSFIRFSEGIEHEEPHEVQRAECTVTAGEVRASAEATTTKTLKGVCGSVEMNLAFHNLEEKMYKELAEIKLLLKELRTGNQEFHQNRPQILFQPTGTTPQSTQLPVDPQKTESVTPPQQHFLKSLHTPARKEENISRDQEVKKLNNTVLSDEDVKIFSYYWKVENFSEKIKEDSEVEESPIFTILGKPLRIRASFNHLKRDFLFLKLEYAKFDQSDRFKNIVLSTGAGLFQQIDDGPSFKHKIAILDQTNALNDLVSQEFHNLDNGFLIPNSALLNNSYSKENKLLMKIFLYLR